MIRTLYITSAAYLFLHLLAFWFPGQTWGVDALVYSDVGGLLFLGIAFALASLWISDSARTKVVEILGNDRDSVDVVLFVVFGALLVVFDSKTHLLGDGRLLIRELTVGAESPTERAPLSLFIARSLFDILDDAELSYTIISVGSGLVFFWIAVALVRLLTKDRLSQRLGIVLLVSQGYVVLFGGYVARPTA